MQSVAEPFTLPSNTLEVVLALHGQDLARWVANAGLRVALIGLVAFAATRFATIATKQEARSKKNERANPPKPIGDLRPQPATGARCQRAVRFAFPTPVCPDRCRGREWSEARARAHAGCPPR